MIDYLDLLMHRLLRNRIGALSTDAQVRFQPPDENWRTYVSTLTRVALNVYLADLRENRRLRSNARERSNLGSDVHETPPPRRVDCHYLISAWSPASVTPTFDPTPDEHALLAEAARLLGEHDELDPVAIYAATTPPAPPPAAIAEERFPITLLPVEGFPKLGEFWGTMGQSHRWKPCLYVIVTVALKEAPRLAGPMVTTLYTHTLQRDVAASLNTRFHIGGTTRVSPSDATPVPHCWVELLTPADSLITIVRADGTGRFAFADVPAGDYHLRARVAALPLPASPPAPTQPARTTSPVRAITVPEPTGSYDITF